MLDRLAKALELLGNARSHCRRSTWRARGPARRPGTCRDARGDRNEPRRQRDGTPARGARGVCLERGLATDLDHRSDHPDLFIARGPGAAEQAAHHAAEGGPHVPDVPAPSVEGPAVLAAARQRVMWSRHGPGAWQAARRPAHTRRSTRHARRRTSRRHLCPPDSTQAQRPRRAASAPAGQTGKQGELFAVYRYHAVFTDSAEPMLAPRPPTATTRSSSRSSPS